MDGSLNIGVSLRFEKLDEVPAGLAMLAVQCINSAAYRRELLDLRNIRAEFEEIPAVAFDAAEHRMRQSRKDAVLLRGLREGSVEFAIVGAGLAVWFLKETLGETVKEAWLESGLHERLKAFLLRRREEKYHEIAENAQRQLERKLDARVEMGYSDNLEHVSITLRVWFHPGEYPRFPRQHEDNFPPGG